MSTPDSTVTGAPPAGTTPEISLHPAASVPAAAPASKGQPKVEIRRLSFFYGKFQALHDIDLDIHDRQITAFIGPSGCGKSTLLRTLNRIYELYPGQRATGRIMLGGRN